MKKLLKFLKEEDGITAIEYALIGGLMAVAIIAAWATLKDKLSSAISNVGEKLAPTPAP